MRKINKLKFTGRRTYCPFCMKIERRTKPIHIIQSSFFGLIKKDIIGYEEYLYETPKPWEMDDIYGNSYCGRCGMILGFVFTSRNKKEQAKWKKRLRYNVEAD